MQHYDDSTNNSVRSRLKELCPGIFIRKCFCYSAHICASEAAAEQIRKRFNFEDEVLSRMHMLEPASVLGIQRKVQEQSLVPFAILFTFPESLPGMIPHSSNLLDNEWRRLAVDLPDFITNMAKQVDKIKYIQPDKFWCAIKTLEGNGNPKLKLVADFAQGCLFLPHANADCERCFSNVNRVKTKDRNKLKTKTVRDNHTSQAVCCCHIQQ